jgi:prephenate dehydratase
MQNDKIQYAMIPIDNSIVGLTFKSYNLVNDYNLRIIGETNVRIRQYLMTLPGQKDKI